MIHRKNLRGLAASLLLAGTCLAQEQGSGSVPPFVPGQKPPGYIPVTGPIDRSIQQPGHHPVDELDRPVRHRGRMCHRGWEVRTDHFVVVSTADEEQAWRMSQALEASWREIGRLADSFTDVHRQPTFALCAVGVLIDDQMRRPAQLLGPEALNNEPNIYITLAAHQPALEEQLPRVRGEALRAFLRVTSIDQRLPDWVQDGLASYFSHAASAEPPQAAVEIPEPANVYYERITFERASADRMFIPRPSRPMQDAGTLWVRYLMEADDAAHLPRFLAAIAATLDPERLYRNERLLEAAVSHGPWTPPIDAREQGLWQVAPLAGEPAGHARQTVERVEAWLKNPLAGQPLIETGQLREPELFAAAAEMTLVLKLAERFDAPGDTAPRPVVIEFGREGAKRSTPALAVAENPLDLQALYRRLTDPGQPAWATIDASGAPLLWYDHQRLAALFAPAQRGEYRTMVRDERTVLEYRSPSGAVLEAWFEENRDDPTRPICRVRQKPLASADQPPVSTK